MSPYQQCPYCEVVVEVASDDKEGLKRHIRAEHAEDERTRHRAA